jgi:predicted dehydrogenase
VGDRASVYCNFQANTLVLYENRHENQGGKWVAVEAKGRDIPIEKAEPLALELKAFMESIRNRSNPVADGKAGYQALKIVEACYASSREGKRVEIEWTI